MLTQHIVVSTPGHAFPYMKTPPSTSLNVSTQFNTINTCTWYEELLSFVWFLKKILYTDFLIIDFEQKHSLTRKCTFSTQSTDHFKNSVSLHHRCHFFTIRIIFCLTSLQIIWIHVKMYLLASGSGECLSEHLGPAGWVGPYWQCCDPSAFSARL